MRKPRLATMWLDGCSGCHMSLLDVDEGLLTIAAKAELVYSPLVDAREYPHDVDVAIVEGAVSSDEDLEKIRLVRERTRILVALGDCAINCGLFKGSYAVSGPVDRHIPVDVRIPGCPPRPAEILKVLENIRRPRASSGKSTANENGANGNE